jgi:hypothetical protein
VTSVKAAKADVHNRDNQRVTRIGRQADWLPAVTLPAHSDLIDERDMLWPGSESAHRGAAESTCFPRQPVAALLAQRAGASPDRLCRDPRW